MRYLLLSSYRCGSRLISRGLQATGVAGDPREYFNAIALKQERARLNRPTLTHPQLIPIVEARSTTPNGVFGMHLHLSQFYEAFEVTGDFDSRMGAFLRGFDKFVWVRRKSRAAQAVSFAIARRTQAWTSADEVPLPSVDDFTDFELVDALRLVCWNDNGWQEIIASLSLPVMTVWYEDLQRDYPACLRSVLDHLGLGSAVSEIPLPQIRKQTTQLNGQLLAKLLDYIRPVPSPSR